MKKLDFNKVGLLKIAGGLLTLCLVLSTFRHAPEAQMTIAVIVPAIA